MMTKIVLRGLLVLAHLFPHLPSRRCRRTGPTCCQLAIAALRSGKGWQAVADIVAPCSGADLSLPRLSWDTVSRWLAVSALTVTLAAGGCGAAGGHHHHHPCFSGDPGPSGCGHHHHHHGTAA